MISISFWSLTLCDFVVARILEVMIKCKWDLNFSLIVTLIFIKWTANLCTKYVVSFSPFHGKYSFINRKPNRIKLNDVPLTCVWVFVFELRYDFSSLFNFNVDVRLFFFYVILNNVHYLFTCVVLLNAERCATCTLYLSRTTDETMSVNYALFWLQTMKIVWMRLFMCKLIKWKLQRQMHKKVLFLMFNSQLHHHHHHWTNKEKNKQ